MKVPLHLVEERRAKLADLLQAHSYLPVQEVCRRLKVSEATARRDLAALARQKRIIRTFGGALAEFNQQFASFHERQRTAARAKTAIAKTVLEFIEPGMSVYFDTGTTTFAVAEAVARKRVCPLRVVLSDVVQGEFWSPFKPADH
jgi:DeoR/GlpR family transcriptional regulator of sugar metabolism